jgi:hypothetical protein
MKSKQADAIQKKTLKESLRTAAGIPRKLKGRIHSDSTERLREDRSGMTTESLVDQAFSLEDLLSGITKENRHSEVGFGAPIGKENARQFRGNSQCCTLVNTRRESDACRPPACQP